MAEREVRAAWAGRRRAPAAPAARRRIVRTATIAVVAAATGFLLVNRSGPRAAPRTATPPALAGGDAWHVQPTPGGVGAITLADVSCPTATFCMAAGNSQLSEDGSSGPAPSQVPVAEAWNGTGWLRPAVVGPGGEQGAFYGVSCASARWCMAVGSEATAGRLRGTARLLAERWNGTEWSATVAPLPAGATGPMLVAVSCPSPDRCVAVGHTAAAPLVELWNGHAWALQPVPGSADGPALLDVSCATARACVAVGQTGTPAGYALSWNGIRWRALSVPAPAGSVWSGLASVSCSSAVACVEVGYYGVNSSSGVVELPVSETWDGSRWRLHPMRPTGYGVEVPEDVSCSSAHDCTSVWWNTAEVWNGIRWRVQPMAPIPQAPDVPASSEVAGVSCLPAGTCTGVGWDGGRSLAERRG